MVKIVPVNKIRTSLSHLRSTSSARAMNLAPLPIRVVISAKENEAYEVVDGFKRLKAAKDDGLEEIAVVIEDAQGADAKALLVSANALQNTLKPLDEARVIKSLLDEDGLSLSAAARLLRRKKSWASKRYALMERLVPSLHKSVDEGRLPVALAYGLTCLAKEEQVKLGQVIIQAGLSHTNGQAFISTYRGLTTESGRKALLQDPLGTIEEFSRKKGESCLGISSLAQRRRACYREIVKLLDEFMSPMQGISLAEERLLAAERKPVIAQTLSPNP